MLHQDSRHRGRHRRDCGPAGRERDVPRRRWSTPWRPADDPGQLAPPPAQERSKGSADRGARCTRSRRRCRWWRSF